MSKFIVGLMEPIKRWESHWHPRGIMYVSGYLEKYGYKNYLICKKLLNKNISLGFAHFTPYQGIGFWYYYIKNNLVKKSSRQYDYHRGRYSGDKIKGIDYGFLRHLEHEYLEINYFKRFMFTRWVQLIWNLKLVFKARRLLEKFAPYYWLKNIIVKRYFK